MIETVKQLNKFVSQTGVKSHSLIIPELIKRQERISADMAKLIQAAKTGSIIIF